MSQVKVQCLCGGVSEAVELRQGLGISLCHCNTCRHSSGLLSTSYYPVQSFRISAQLQKYETSSRSTTYFCKSCGCHIARSRKRQSGGLDWEIASGTAIESDATYGPVFDHHGYVEDTRDGGISPWITSLRLDESKMSITDNTMDLIPDAKPLSASCICGTVRFEVTRPGSESREPCRWLPDLMYPDKTTSADIKQNKDDIKWWIPGNEGKYLAGTCACKSCRQSSGFEIQTWAFVPRTNIFFLTPGTDHDNPNRLPLDFATLPPGILQTNRSSPNVCRDFCGTCGASVFWREKDKPDVIDISVGLFRSSDGARAESWLHWWTGRTSFSEDVVLGRTGWAARAATSLVESLEQGLKSWKHQKSDNTMARLR